MIVSASKRDRGVTGVTTHANRWRSWTTEELMPTTKQTTVTAGSHHRDVISLLSPWNSQFFLFLSVGGFMFFWCILWVSRRLLPLVSRLSQRHCAYCLHFLSCSITQPHWLVVSKYYWSSNYKPRGYYYLTGHLWHSLTIFPEPSHLYVGKFQSNLYILAAKTLLSSSFNTNAIGKNKLSVFDGQRKTTFHSSTQNSVSVWSSLWL